MGKWQDSGAGKGRRSKAGVAILHTTDDQAQGLTLYQLMKPSDAKDTGSESTFLGMYYVSKEERICRFQIQKQVLLRVIYIVD